MTQAHDFLASADRETLRRILALSWAGAWPLIHKAWSEAEEVCTDLVGSGRFVRETLAFALAREIPVRYPGAESDLLGACTAGNARLAAYAVVCLDLIRRGASPPDLPESVLRRAETIDVSSGCFRSTVTLGEFARSYVRPAADPPARARLERHWAGRSRACPKCSTSFTSVQDLGTCPGCTHSFRASDAYPGLG